MEQVVQWGITTIVGILTFLGGRAFERRKISNQNRLKLLEPIEAWVDKASRLIGIVGDDLSAISQGLPLPISYSPQERIETSKGMGETKEKVLGILSSRALSTRGTRSLAIKLRERLVSLGVIIEREYLQTHMRVMDKITACQDPSSEMFSLLQTSILANVLIKDIHEILAELKTRFN